LRKAKKDFLKFEKKSYRKLTKQIKQKELLEIQFFSVQEELEKEYLSKKDISSKMELRQKDIQELKTQINQKEKNNKDLKSQVDKEKKKYSEQKEENELLLTQLFSVQEELERYYLKSLEPKKKVLKNNGAVNKIKRQLKYKIGKKALSKQNSFFGKILLPISLIIVYLKHKEDKEYLKEFSYYDDYFEARRLKSGLEYTIGQNIKKDASGIFGVFKLPFVVSNTIKEFKNK
ncbi:MAG: hypothetical protein U9N33_07790, partial [Campylobacterota bacterium]|nr:hypothetical protein [Campylobacterota bacterium]